MNNEYEAHGCLSLCLRLVKKATEPILDDPTDLWHSFKNHPEKIINRRERVKQQRIDWLLYSPVMPALATYFFESHIPVGDKLVCLGSQKARDEMIKIIELL